MNMDKKTKKQQDADLFVIEKILDSQKISGVLEAWVRSKFQKLIDGAKPDDLFQIGRALQKSKIAERNQLITLRHIELVFEGETRDRSVEIITEEFSVSDDVVERALADWLKVFRKNFPKKKRL
jgi:hypothetical protein